MSELGILPNPIPFGKYYLLERVNIGGMAEIFKAKAFGVEGFERLLAVKKILSSIAEDEAFINMFIDEAKIAGQLNHPNIAQIFDLGKVDGSYFIALEYISGKDMKTIFERSRRIGEKVSIPRVCYIMMKTCEGLGHAHAKKDAQGQDLNIVHRDVSPQNILISYEGESKIIDFGIAKAQGKTSQTQVGILKGKFSYMSPEQVRGLHIDRRSDIFSLGIVLYEMLTLERLFLGESDFDTLEKIRKVEMSPPSLYNPHIPKELEDIVLKALAKSPEDRYQTAYEFADALEQFMRNQGYYYTNKDLGAYMKESFSADIEFENKKLEYYRSLNLRPPTSEYDALGSQPSEPAPQHQMSAGLSWGDDEYETQIYDRGSEVDIVESLIDADIIFSEDLGSVQGTGESRDSSPGVPSAEDPPTVEFNRDAISKSLEEFSFNDDPPDGRSPQPRQPMPTAKLPSIEPRRDHSHTMPNAAIPTPAPKPAYSRATVLIVGLLVAGAGIAVIYALWPWPAQLTITTTPADVRVLIDGKQVHDGETPLTYKLQPGVHSIELLRDGYQKATIEQEFLKSRPYAFTKKLVPTSESGGADKPKLLVKTTPEDATIEINGKSFSGKSPKEIKDFEPGKYSAKISAAGYATKTQEIELKEGGSDADFKLEPVKFTLNLTSSQNRIEYAVTDKSTDKVVKSGKLPAVIKDLEGPKTYSIKLSKRGFVTKEELITPASDAERKLDVSLTEDKPTEVASTAPPKKDPPKEDKKIVKKDPPKEDKKVVKKDPPKEDKKIVKKDPPKKDPPKKGTATLTIASKPAARVYIDGKDTGRYTPLIKYKVSTDNHKIELKNPEFSLHKTYYVKGLKPGESRKIVNR